MVEIVQRGCLLLAGMLFTTWTANAQEIQARIAGLETHAEYMEMLRADARLQFREDSISSAVSRMREQLRGNASEHAVHSVRILELESALFDIRTQRGRLTDRINAIEQEWILTNLDPTTGISAPDRREERIPLPDSLQKADLVHNPYLRDHLPAVDYRALVYVQRHESDAVALFDAYRHNYDSIARIKIRYDTLSDEQAANALYDRYQDLYRRNNRLNDSLAALWNTIFDNKSYAYQYLLDQMGRDDLLTRGEKRMADMRQQAASERGHYQSDELMEYVFQKQALTQYEQMIAQTLGLTLAEDSLKRTAAALQRLDYRLPKLFVERRLFLDYEPLEFSSPSKYNAQNPIPELRIYERGTIYRILLARYTNKTNGGYLFKGAAPIGYIRDSIDRKYLYYAGGFRTREEAETACEELKRHGLRRPEIVVWNDGESTNITESGTDAVPLFRVEIVGLAAMSEELKSAIIAASGEGCEISRAGQSFVIGTFADRTAADRVAETIAQHDPTLRVEISEIEE